MMTQMGLSLGELLLQMDSLHALRPLKFFKLAALTLLARPACLFLLVETTPKTLLYKLHGYYQLLLYYSTMIKCPHHTSKDLLFLLVSMQTH